MFSSFFQSLRRHSKHKAQENVMVEKSNWMTSFFRAKQSQSVWRGSLATCMGMGLSQEQGKECRIHIRCRISQYLSLHLHVINIKRIFLIFMFFQRITHFSWYFMKVSCSTWIQETSYFERLTAQLMRSSTISRYANL